jgi:hypothetical protein
MLHILKHILFFILTNIKQTMDNEAKVDATFGAKEENI